MRDAIRNSSKFFNSQERISKFKALGLTEHTEEAIEIGILSVLAKEKVADIGGVFKALLREGLDAESNETCQTIEKWVAKHCSPNTQRVSSATKTRRSILKGSL